MNRSGYTEEGDNWSVVRWRGAVKAAIRGKRGQAFLRELACTCEQCEAVLSRRSARVALVVGELKFSREYAL